MSAQRNHMELTPSQAAAMEELRGFLDSPDQRCYILRGYAGTGKTFLINELCLTLAALNRHVCLMAPTGRAAKVLSRRTGQPAFTIHKVIYAMDQLKEYVQTDVDGSETFKFYFDLKENLDDASTVYIIDEASMVSDEYSEGEFFRFGSGFLLRDLLKYVNFDHNDHGKRLILVGDPAQLPPVGSNHSPALMAGRFGDLRTGGLEMTDVVRHRAGSGILANATVIRDAIRGGRLNILNVKADRPDVQAVDYDKVLDRYAELGNGNPPEDAVIIGYSNRLVNDYNRDIRARHFPDANGPVSGDRLLVVANNHKGDISLMNGDLVKLLSASPSVTSRTVTLRKKTGKDIVETPVTLVFRDVEIEAESPRGEPIRLATTIIENLLDSPERDVGSDLQKALYIDFKIRNPGLKPGSALFKDALRTDKYFGSLRVKYGYAMTCHKAQGGEWPHVFVDFSSPGGVFNMTYFRWAYTAITRAREMLHVINAPHYDAITPVKKAGQAAPSIKIREDLFLLEPQFLENETPDTPLAEYPFPRRLYLAVSSLLADKGIEVEKVESCQFCEHYHFRLAEDRAVFLLHYNAHNVVTRILPASRSGVELQRGLAPVLDLLLNKFIVIEGETSDSRTHAGVEAAVPEIEYAHIAEAYAELAKRAGADGIAVSEVRAVSRYHLYCVFSKGGHKAAVDYHFNGTGRLTCAIPRHQATTRAELMQQILGYSAGS